MNAKKKITIFIVDDNVIFAMTLKANIEVAFKNVPFKIHTFETGEECLDSFDELQPDLVILDFYLNSKSVSAADGLQILTKIKKNSFKTSVVILTSNDQIDTALKSFRHGAADYVIKTEKPFKKIISSINNILINKEIDLQEKEKQSADLVTAHKELEFQNEEKEKRAAELVIVNIQNAEVEKSKLLAEEKNRSITDSINYAKRIQEAQLPRIEEIYSSLPQSFVLFKPKDIVSGDFYFFHKPLVKDEKNKSDVVFIVAADCTGHGIPGAFMSMIGSEKLVEAVAHSLDPSEILKHLNKGIKNSLHQSDDSDSTKDGMDIAICSIDVKTRVLKYSGANRPLWIIRKGQTNVEEIKATKKAIGGFTENDQHFDIHEVQLQEGDTFYISTDGYADQFGIEKDKKLMTKRFKEILLSIQNKSMSDQGKHLDDFMETWRSGIEQVDDILVIGVRL